MRSSTKNINSSLSTGVSTRSCSKGKRKLDEYLGNDHSSASEGKGSQDESQRRVSPREPKPNSRLGDYLSHEVYASVMQQIGDDKAQPHDRYKYFRAISRRNAKVMPVFTSISGTHIGPDGVNESPAKRFRLETQELKGVMTPSGIETLIASKSGTKLRIRKNATGEVLDLVFQMRIKIGDKQEVSLHQYQDTKSAALGRKSENIIEEDVQKAAACPEPKDTKYVINRREITRETLEEAKKSRPIKSNGEFKATAIAANAQLDPSMVDLTSDGVEMKEGVARLVGHREHCHVNARRHGQHETVAVNGKDSYITFVGSYEYNTLHLVTCEIPAIADCIEILGKLYFSSETTLLTDIHGKRLPIIKFENIIWQDEHGTEMKFIYKDALKRITPAIQHEDVVKAVVKCLFPDPAKKEVAVATDDNHQSAPTTTPMDTTTDDDDSFSKSYHPI